MDKKKISFSWDIHWDCNYRCPYCWWHGRWDELKERNVYPGLDKLIRVWKRISDKYGEGHIEIAGGEPFIYPEFFEFMDELLKYHTAGVMTNLSGDINRIFNVISPGRLHRLKIGASFHPMFTEYEEFLEKILELRKKDMSVGVLYLSYPPQIPKIPYYRKEFADNDINFSVSTFWGVYEGKEYPDSYTEEELKIINPALGNRVGEKFQTKPFSTLGKKCNAGHLYGIIHPDGEVLPCGGGSWRGKNIIIGNIFDEDFILRDKPHICHSEYCPCNEWAFLLVEKDT